MPEHMATNRLQIGLLTGVEGPQHPVESSYGRSRVCQRVNACVPESEVTSPLQPHDVLVHQLFAILRHLVQSLEAELLAESEGGRPLCANTSSCRQRSAHQLRDAWNRA